MRRFATWTMAALLAAAVPVAAQSTKAADPKEVTLIGCVELEKDYRARMNAAKGGPLSSGVGQGNEYVLVAGKPESAGNRREAVGTAGQMGDYMLTGKSETEMKGAVGKQVEVVGTVKPFEVHESAADSRNRLPVLAISTWHPVSDFCPAK